MSRLTLLGALLAAPLFGCAARDEGTTPAPGGQENITTPAPVLAQPPAPQAGGGGPTVPAPRVHWWGNTASGERVTWELTQTVSAAPGPPWTFQRASDVPLVVLDIVAGELMAWQYDATQPQGKGMPLVLLNPPPAAPTGGAALIGPRRWAYPVLAGYASMEIVAGR